MAMTTPAPGTGSHRSSRAVVVPRSMAHRARTHALRGFGSCRRWRCQPRVLAQKTPNASDDQKSDAKTKDTHGQAPARRPPHRLIYPVLGKPRASQGTQLKCDRQATDDRQGRGNAKQLVERHGGRMARPHIGYLLRDLTRGGIFVGVRDCAWGGLFIVRSGSLPARGVGR